MPRPVPLQLLERMPMLLPSLTQPGGTPSTVQPMATARTWRRRTRRAGGKHPRTEGRKQNWEKEKTEHKKKHGSELMNRCLKRPLR